MTRLILHFPEMQGLACRLAGRLGAQPVALLLHHFPDGETLVTIRGELTDADVIVLASLNDPDRKALPLRFAADTARELGARRVGLIAPYLAYMRQDARFAPGQAVSARLFARFLSQGFDWLVTLDPHLHRIAALEDIFTIPVRAASSAKAVASWIAANVSDGVLIGPDEESRQWVEQVAQLAGCAWLVLKKQRKSDFEVALELPETDLLDQGTPVIVDDIASSGRTMAQTVRLLVRAGARAPICIVIHPVFAGDALALIRQAGASAIASCDSIPHPTNAIAIDECLAGPAGDILARLPRST